MAIVPAYHSALESDRKVYHDSSLCRSAGREPVESVAEGLWHGVCMARQFMRVVAIAGFAALLCGAAPAWAQTATAPSLGAAQSFAAA